MEAIVTLRPTGGTPAANGVDSANGTDANGTPDTNGADPTNKAPTDTPTLQQAIDALPLSGYGTFTRERLAPLAQQHQAAEVLLRCVDEMDYLPGLVETLRAAGKAYAEDPTWTRREGLDAFTELLVDHLRRLSAVQRSALVELEPSAQADQP